MAKIIHSKILGGWYVCRGPHNTPISGGFPSKAEAEAWLDRKNRKAATAATVLRTEGLQAYQDFNEGNY